MKGQRPAWRTRMAPLIGAIAAASILGSGCFNGAIGEPGTSCQSTRQYFLEEVWGPVLAQRCASCHLVGGTAPLQGARFQLLPASYPDFADANLAAQKARGLVLEHAAIGVPVDEIGDGEQGANDGDAEYGEADEEIAHRLPPRAQPAALARARVPSCRRRQP